MRSASEHPIIAIVGPTASGKSEVAQSVALRIGGEIVSADSMQVYRFMDIGTAKLPVRKRRVPHHGIDLVDPDEEYSAALFQRYARETFAAIRKREAWPLLAGGSGLYVRAALDDLHFAPGAQRKNPIREELQAFADANGPEELWRRLEAVDPESAAQIHPNNVRRVIRALEMRHHGDSYATRKAAFAERPAAVESIRFGLSVDPALLAKRIDRRVDAMMEEGLYEEVESLLDRGFRSALTAKQAIGYKELIAAIEGTLSLEEAVTSIKTATRRLAKRQRTWFRRDPSIRWLDADDGDIEALSGTIIETLEREGLHGQGGSEFHDDAICQAQRPR